MLNFFIIYVCCLMFEPGVCAGRERGVFLFIVELGFREFSIELNVRVLL